MQYANVQLSPRLISTLWNNQLPKLQHSQCLELELVICGLADVNSHLCTFEVNIRLHKSINEFFFCAMLEHVKLITNTLAILLPLQAWVINDDVYCSE